MVEFGPILYNGLGLPNPGSKHKLRADHNGLTKKADADSSGFAETEELYSEVFRDRGAYPEVIQALQNAGMEDPYEERAEIKAYVQKLFKRYGPSTEKEKAILLFRAIIYWCYEFSVCEARSDFGCRGSVRLNSGAIFSGLSENEGGLSIPYNDDFGAPSRKKFGNPRPRELMSLPQEQRVAHCQEYSNLLVSLLRAAEIKAHSKREGKHVYVIAVLDGIKYKLDAASLIFSRTDEEADMDFTGILSQYINEKGMFAKQGRWEESFLVWQRMMEIIPNDVSQWNRLGLELAKRGRAKKAVAAFRRCLEIDPGYAMAWNNLGVLHIKLGRKEKALYALNKALELDPENAAIRRNLERMLSFLKRSRETAKASADKDKSPT